MRLDFPLIRAVENGIQNGLIFRIDGRTRLIVHKSGFSILEHNQEIDIKTILDFFHDQKGLPRYFHLYDPPDQIYETIRSDRRFGIKYRKRVQYRLLNNKIVLGRADVGSSVHVSARISEHNYDQLDIFKLQLGNRFWKSKQDFLDNGFGIVVYSDDLVPASLCYTACVVNGLAEIDIVTLPGFEGKGYATSAALEFIRLSQSRNIIPNWDCFVDNKASSKIARKMNFQELGRYNFLSVYRN